MKVVLTVALLVASAQALAMPAFWTGQMRFITTATYKSGVRCEYSMGGEKWWQTFVLTSCPVQIEVE